MIERLPTRPEWERDRSSAPPARPNDTDLPAAVTRALASIQEWRVPLDGAPGSAQDPSIRKQLKRSAHDRVADALKTANCEGLPINVGSSIGNEGALYVSASVSLSHDRSIEQRFATAIQRNGRLALLQPDRAINLVGANGGVIRSSAAQNSGTPDRAHGGNRRFLITAYVSAVLIPVIGIFVALYAALSRRRAAIRRNAIAIAGVSLLAGGGYGLAIRSVVNANQDSRVASRLRSLFDSHGIRYDRVSDCYHQNGNQYVCTVTENGQQIFVQVTDDGKTIYEHGGIGDDDE